MDALLTPAAPAGLAPRRARSVSRLSVPRAQPWTLFHAALAGMVLTYVWRVQDLFPLLGRLKLTALITLAGYGLFFVGPALTAPRRLRTPLFRLAAVTLGLMVLSVPGSLYARYAFDFVVKDHVKTFLLMVMVMAGVHTLAQVRAALAVMVAGAVLYCLVVITTFQMHEGRLHGLVYYDSNDLGMLLVGMLPVAVYFARPGARPATRAAAAAVCLILLATLVRTGSRGAFLGLLAVSAFMLVRFRAFTARARLRAVLGGLAAVVVLGNAQYWEMMRTLLHPQDDYNWAGNAQSGRMEVWKRGFRYMIDRPLLGVGPACFFVAEGRLSPQAALQELGRGLKWSAPHNSYVQVGAELGVPGLLVFLLMLRAAWRTARPAAPGAGRGRGRGPPGTPAHPDPALGEALAAALVGYAVTAFFLTQAYAVFLYVLVGLIAAYGRAVEAEPASPPAARARPHTPGRGGGWGLAATDGAG
jgi:hypothetical protein